MPSKIGIVVFPGFEMLDAFGPLEALYILSHSHKLDLYVIAASLEPVYTGTSNPTFNPRGSRFGVSPGATEASLRVQDFEGHPDQNLDALEPCALSRPDASRRAIVSRGCDPFGYSRTPSARPFRSPEP